MPSCGYYPVLKGIYNAVYGFYKALQGFTNPLKASESLKGNPPVCPVHHRWEQHRRTAKLSSRRTISAEREEGVRGPIQAVEGPLKGYRRLRDM